jgi:hypothetical protein
MNDARTDVAHTPASDAARQLARARWGNVRVRRLAHELSGRADELGSTERAELVEALAVTEKDTTTLEES